MDVQKQKHLVDLQQGDCLELMKNIPDKSIDLILCDLPYGTTRNRWDNVIDLELLWEAYLRISKVNTAIVLTAQTPFDKILAVSNLSMLRYEWIWEKTEATGHMNAKKMPMKAHENVLVFYRKLPTYNPQKTFGHKRKTAVADRDRLQSDCYGLQKSITSYDSTERYPRSVIKLSTDKQTNRLHSTQKPLALMEYFIKTYSNQGDVVLDNCMGSGTTGVAAIKEGRGFIGMELDKEIFEVAKERIEKYI